MGKKVLFPLLITALLLAGCDANQVTQSIPDTATATTEPLVEETQAPTPIEEATQTATAESIVETPTPEEPWYQSLTQKEMVEIAENSTRLVELNSAGVRIDVPFNRIDKGSLAWEEVGITYIDHMLYGVVIDEPQLELLPVIDFRNGEERYVEVYTVPYMFSTKQGEYLVKTVVLGREDQKALGYTAYSHTLRRSIPGTHPAIPIPEIVSKITVNAQHGLELTYFENVEGSRIDVAEHPDDQRRVDFHMINYTYRVASLEFFDALSKGTNLNELPSLDYLPFLTGYILNVED